MADLELDGWTVTVQDTGVPSGGRFAAKLTKETGYQKFLTRYVYGVSKEEALENAKKEIEESK